MVFLLVMLCGCSQQKVESSGREESLASGVEESVPAPSIDMSESDQRSDSAELGDGVSKTVEESAESEGEEVSEVVADEDVSGDEISEEDEMSEFDDEFEEAEESKVSDPLEGYNRVMTKVNDKLYFWVLKPVASGYRWLVPKGVRRGIQRFFTNLLYPIRAVNNLLQLKLKNAGEETLRFLTNSTIGVLGFWDPAKEWFGLEAHNEDFGQTLGYYGVGPGPHLVLPVFGPRNLRDAVAMYPDTVYLDPVTVYVDDTRKRVAIQVFDKINYTSLNLGKYENIKKDAFDFYILLRDGYEKIREKEIKE